MNVSITATVTYEIEDVSSIEGAMDIFNYMIQPSKQMEGVFLTTVSIHKTEEEEVVF